MYVYNVDGINKVHQTDTFKQWILYICMQFVYVHKYVYKV